VIQRYLLDTNVVAWWVAEPRRIGPKTREAVDNGTNHIFVSAAAIAEIAIKVSLGKFPTMDLWRERLPVLAQSCGFSALDVTIDHAAALAKLPNHHRDPFDRLLIAQAMVENLTLVTVDPLLGAYGIPILRADT
jgi:PIN domain nuclease of toxin-antitoxin system